MASTLALNTVVKLAAYIAALLVTDMSASAQEIAYVDMADIAPRTEVRRPALPEKKCLVHHMCGFVKEEVVGGDVSPNDKRSVETTLRWMDKLEYRDDDRAEFEVMVRNVGEVPIDIPWTPHLADLQPTDDSVPFDVSTFGISLEMRWAQGESTQIGTVVLFGAENCPNTLLNLKPGEWVRLRGRTTLSLLQYKGSQLPPLSASVGAVANSWLRLEHYSPQPGGLNVNERNIFPHRSSGTPLAVRILPRQQ